MSENLFEQNKIIKQEADKILLEKKVLEILNGFGTPHISGSYSLDLMTWRDLDIYLEVHLISEDQFFRLGAELCAALSPLRMHFRNERIAATKNLPDGLYWGIYLGNERAGDWKIDVWAVSAKEYDRLLSYCETIREGLDEASSGTILSIKSQCWKDPEYRRVYSSSDIYEAVLKGAVKDLEGFWKYLDK